MLWTATILQGLIDPMLFYPFCLQIYMLCLNKQNIYTSFDKLYPVLYKPPTEIGGDNLIKIKKLENGNKW